MRRLDKAKVYGPPCGFLLIFVSININLFIYDYAKTLKLPFVLQCCPQELILSKVGLWFMNYFLPFA